MDLDLVLMGDTRRELYIRDYISTLNCAECSYRDSIYCGCYHIKFLVITANVVQVCEKLGSFKQGPKEYGPLYGGKYEDK